MRKMFNPFMHNVVKWPNVMHETVNNNLESITFMIKMASDIFSNHTLNNKTLF